jgi:hypothetical protein
LYGMHDRHKISVDIAKEEGKNHMVPIVSSTTCYDHHPLRGDCRGTAVWSQFVKIRLVCRTVDLSVRVSSLAGYLRQYGTQQSTKRKVTLRGKVN